MALDRSVHIMFHICEDEIPQDISYSVFTSSVYFSIHVEVAQGRKLGRLILIFLLAIMRPESKRSTSVAITIDKVIQPVLRLTLKT